MVIETKTGKEGIF